MGRWWLIIQFGGCLLCNVWSSAVLKQQSLITIDQTRLFSRQFFHGGLQLLTMDIHRPKMDIYRYCLARPTKKQIKKKQMYDCFWNSNMAAQQILMCKDLIYNGGRFGLRQLGVKSNKKILNSHFLQFCGITPVNICPYILIHCSPTFRSDRQTSDFPVTYYDVSENTSQRKRIPWTLF